MERWPTRNGIAVPPDEMWLPRPNTKDRNNHHSCWTRKRFEKHATLLALRNLDRHQYEMPVNQHNWLHKNYDPPELPTHEQAAKEVIDAYDKGEQFKIYNKQCHWYDLKDIPSELADSLVAKYSLVRIFDMAAD